MTEKEHLNLCKYYDFLPLSYFIYLCYQCRLQCYLLSVVIRDPVQDWFVSILDGVPQRPQPCRLVCVSGIWCVVAWKSMLLVDVRVQFALFSSFDLR